MAKGLDRVIDDYIKAASWRINENSSFTYSLGGLEHQLSGYASADYWLKRIYPKQVGKAHRVADLHIHDLGMLAPYCNGWSLRQLLTEGISGLPNRVASGPANHMMVAVVQIVNFIGVMSNESAGAQAFSSLDTYLAPFVREEKLDYKSVKQYIQMLIFGLNIESRWSGQPPFSNLTFDWTVPQDMKDKACYFGGTVLDYTYAELQDEMDMINKAFIEVMLEGDHNGRMFAYPIPTYNITRDFDWEKPNVEKLFEMAGKYGTPYFQNFVNSDLDPEAVRSMCCRLQLDVGELKRRGGGLFGAEEFTGSIGVVTINMPRIAYRASGRKHKIVYFYEELERLMDLSSESLEIKRDVLNRLNDINGSGRSLYPYTKRFLERGWVNHFSTIGLVGMNEACLNLFGKDLTDPESINFAVDVLDFMKKKILSYQEKTGNLYNLEASPAEGTAYRFAKHDKKRFKSIITAGTEESPYYTNSTHLPVNATDDIFEALDMQEPLQTAYTGGTVFHAYLPEALSSTQAQQLVKTAFDNYRLPYMSITPTFSVCPDHGYIKGEKFECPECGGATEVYSRVTGYVRAISKFNIGKKQEYKDRKEYTNMVDTGIETI